MQAIQRGIFKPPPIVRDLILGKARYGEFSQSMEGTTNILAQRLKHLEMSGVVVKSAYRLKPVRYEYALTDKGRDLIPVLEAMVTWADKHVPGVKVFPYFRPERNRPEDSNSETS